jgi:hypothetical protein
VNDHNTQTIIGAASSIDLPIPTAAAEAQAFAAEAHRLLDSVRTDSAPDLATATTKTLAKVHAAAVEFDATHDARLRHAEALVKVADERVATAWTASITDVVEALGEAFDKTAQEFAAELDKAGDVDADVITGDRYNREWDRLRVLADRLATLKGARDAYAHWSGSARNPLGFEGLEKLTRVCILQDPNLAFNPPKGMGKHERADLAWFAAAVRHPDIELKWQSPQQQREQPCAKRFADFEVKRAALQAERA